MPGRVAAGRRRRPGAVHDDIPPDHIVIDAMIALTIGSTEHVAAPRHPRDRRLAADARLRDQAGARGGRLHLLAREPGRHLSEPAAARGRRAGPPPARGEPRRPAGPEGLRGDRGGARGARPLATASARRPAPDAGPPLLEAPLRATGEPPRGRALDRQGAGDRPGPRRCPPLRSAGAAGRPGRPALLLRAVHARVRPGSHGARHRVPRGPSGPRAPPARGRRGRPRARCPGPRSFGPCGRRARTRRATTRAAQVVRRRPPKRPV